MLSILTCVLTIQCILDVAESTKMIDDITCLWKLKTWLEEDYLLLSWDLPDNVSLSNTSDLHPIVKWYRDYGWTRDEGSCSVMTLTSCRMNYGDDNAPRFVEQFGFNLSVMITANDDVLFQKSTWIENITECREPPRVRVSQSSVTSSCAVVTWAYDNQQGCSDKLWRRSYRTSYRPVHGDSSKWRTNVTQMKSPDTCSGSSVSCGLHPYTAYEIKVECRATNLIGEETGWSEPASLFVKTKESVPSAAPEVTPSGFSYNRADCVEGEMREVTVYWKNLPEKFVNGILRGYKIEIYQNDIHSKTKVRFHNVLAEDVVSFTADMSCSRASVVSLRAFTAKGASAVSSSIHIPKDAEILTVDIDVIPMVQEDNKDVLVSMLFHNQFPFNITSYTVYWCEKRLDGKCENHFNCTVLSHVNEHYLIKAAMLSHAIHKYKIGVSIESTNRSSGIIWSSCLYADDKELTPPRNVQLRHINVGGMLKVEWDNPSCDNVVHGPYITSYKVYMCVVKNDSVNNCSGNIMNKDVSGSENSVTFSEIKSKELYGAYVVALTRSGITRKSKFVKGRTFTDGSTLEPAIKIAFATGASFALVLMLTGVAVIRNCIWNRWKRRDEITDLINNSEDRQMLTSL